MKLINSKVEINPLISEESGTIWDYLKTSYKNYGRPNSDKTITFYSQGIRKIKDNYYEFKIERTYNAEFESQTDYDIFLNKTLINLDELIFQGFGDDSQAEILN